MELLESLQTERELSVTAYSIHTVYSQPVLSSEFANSGRRAMVTEKGSIFVQFKIFAKQMTRG